MKIHGVAVQIGGRRRRPFPKPILDVIPQLRLDKNGDTIWLEWQADKRVETKMALTLVQVADPKNRERRLWGTWEKPAAAGMEWALKQAGILVYGGRHWELDWYDGERFALWYLPPGAAD